MNSCLLNSCNSEIPCLLFLKRNLGSIRIQRTSKNTVNASNETVIIITIFYLSEYLNTKVHSKESGKHAFFLLQLWRTTDLLGKEHTHSCNDVQNENSIPRIDSQPDRIDNW